MADSYEGPARTLLDHIKRDARLQEIMLRTSARRPDQTNLEMLVAGDATWEGLAAMLASEDGATKVNDCLRTEYGLTYGAAAETVRVLEEVQREGACVSVAGVCWGS